MAAGVSPLGYIKHFMAVTAVIITGCLAASTLLPPPDKVNSYSSSGLFPYFQKHASDPFVFARNQPTGVMTQLYMESAYPRATPISFIWFGSVPSAKHLDNIQDWALHGHPVVLWYIPGDLLPGQIQQLHELESAYNRPGWYNQLLALDLTQAGLDQLYHGGMSITRLICSLSRTARVNKQLYATASNLARVALLVMGQQAILNAVSARNDADSGHKTPLPVFHAPGMLYMDTDLYHYRSECIRLPTPEADFGVHIFRNHGGILQMNNDLLYARNPSQSFFTSLLQTMMNKFNHAGTDTAYAEYMHAFPPEYNGVFFMHRHLMERVANDLNLIPSVRMTVEPQQMEGNWHNKSYYFVLPSNSTRSGSNE